MSLVRLLTRAYARTPDLSMQTREGPLLEIVFDIGRKLAGASPAVLRFIFGFRSFFLRSGRTFVVYRGSTRVPPTTWPNKLVASRLHAWIRDGHG